jgi:hypothetical protein
MVETRARRKAREEREAAGSPQPTAPQPVPALVPDVPPPLIRPAPAPTSDSVNHSSVASVLRKRKRRNVAPEPVPEENGIELGQGEEGSEEQATTASDVEEEESEFANAREPGKKRRLSKQNGSHPSDNDEVSSSVRGSGDGLQLNGQYTEDQRNEVSQLINGEGSNDNPTLRPFDLQYLLSSRVLPVQRAMLSCLGPLEISVLSRTGGFSDMRQTLRRTDYNINKRLEHFFNDINEFRRILARFQGIIVGAVATNFFDRVGELPKTCCVNILESGLRELGRFLKREGYRCTDEDGESDTGSSNESYVYSGDFDGHKIHRKHGGLEIEVLGHSNAPIHGFLDTQWDTLSLTFITHEKAYSLFPRSTYQRREIYPLWRLKERTTAPILRKNCQKFGYRSITTSVDETVEAEMAAPRRIGDKYTMVIPLDMTGLEHIPGYSVVSNVEYTTFRLGVNPLRNVNGNEGLDRYKIAIKPLRHGVMEQGFVTMDWDDDEGAPDAERRVERYSDRIDTIPIKRYITQVDRIAKKVRDYTVMELIKLPVDQRPPGLQAAQDIHNLPIQVIDEDDIHDVFQQEYPVGWPTFDNEVCRMLDTAWDELQVSLERRKRKAVEEHGFSIFP